MPTPTFSLYGRWALGSIALSLWLLACPGSIPDSKPFFAAREGIAIVEAAPTDATPNEPSETSSEISPESLPTEQIPESDLPAGCDPPKLFATSCTDAYCHDDVTKSASLDLKSTGIAARILGAESSICKGSKLLDPQAPLDGVFWKKISPPAPCGAPMPLGKDPLTTEAKDCLKAWLLSISKTP